MDATTFWKTVVDDRSGFLESVLSTLRANRINFCVIGGQAVNAYADPVVSLDLDIVVAVDQIDEAEKVLGTMFKVERFPIP